MGQFQSLSESEMEIMRVIWDAGSPVTAAELLELFAHKGWKIQTVSTFLSRLVEKGVLSVERRKPCMFGISIPNVPIIV